MALSNLRFLEKWSWASNQHTSREYGDPKVLHDVVNVNVFETKSHSARVRSQIHRGRRDNKSAAQQRGQFESGGLSVSSSRETVDSIES